MVERVRGGRRNTRAEILDASVDLFGARGFGATSLDDIAGRVGVAKQTLLYWFPSKDELLDAVLGQTALELATTIEAAVRAAPDEPLARIEAVVKAVFRPAVRRPALLGLVREVSRLSPTHAERLTLQVQPFVRRATEYLGEQMAAGRLRQANPGLVIALAYATVVGVATEPEALRAVEWPATPSGLRRLRAEMIDFLLAALRP
jgi:TetR/AcrR family transcriptional regulator